jgi:hypothetical protein
MIDSDRIGHPATALVILVIWIFSVWGAWETSKRNVTQQQHKINDTKQYARDAYQDIGSKCLDTNPVKFTECATKILEATEESKTARHDLEQQSQMAFWARLMFWVTASMAVISTIGIWFVYRTLIATQKTLKAANAANEIMRAERRPWLTVRRDVNGILMLKSIDDERNSHGFVCGAHLVWKYRPENVGKSPAFGVITKQKIFCTADFFMIEKEFEKFLEKIDFDIETSHQTTIFPSENTNFTTKKSWTLLTDMPDGQASLVLFHALLYRSQESDIKGVEARVLHIEFDRGSMGPWPVKLLEQSRWRVTR